MSIAADSHFAMELRRHALGGTLAQLIRKYLPVKAAERTGAVPVEDLERLASISPHLLSDLGFTCSIRGDREVWTHAERTISLVLHKRAEPGLQGRS